MMKLKISTKGRYGIRAMLDLTIHSSVEKVALNSIAERQDISVNYLEQVFSILRKAGLVKSIKGAQGGYLLGHHPSEITVGAVLRALEGDLLIVGESNQTKGGTSNNFEYCIRTTVWNKIEESINHIVDSLTLEDLATEYKKLDESLAYMFHI